MGEREDPSSLGRLCEGLIHRRTAGEMCGEVGNQEMEMVGTDIAEDPVPIMNAFPLSFFLPLFLLSSPDRNGVCGEAQQT